MKKIILLLIFLFLGSRLHAVASHVIGGEITYQQISTTAYQVYFKLYRDCAGPANISTFTALFLRAPGCNVGRNISLNLVSRQFGKPYCLASLNLCSSATTPNYEVITYSNVLTFSPAELACPDWVLSWSGASRQSSANLMNSGGTDGYCEAKLKLLPSLINNSPAFNDLNAPVMYVNPDKDYYLSMAATDPDGDSLVYSLTTPLGASGTVIPYAPAPQPNYINVPDKLLNNPVPLPPYSNPFNPQIAQVQGIIPATYTANYPMPSIFLNWKNPPSIPYTSGGNTVMIWPAIPHFSIGVNTGELKFHTPVQVVSQQLGQNIYFISIKVEKYRKINGLATKIGEVRRETLIQVLSPSVNANPALSTPIANNQPVLAGDQISLRPGTSLNLQLSATDADLNDSVSLTSNAVNILPGATFTVNAGAQQSGTITWTPTSAHVRAQPYYVQIQAMDNACPLRGLQTKIIAIRVSNTGGVTGTMEALAVADFRAYPNPFSEELNFKFNLKSKAESIIIYNLLGQQIDRISLAKTGIGEQNIQWQNDGKYAAGTYVAKLVAVDKTVQTIKFTKLQ